MTKHQRPAGTKDWGSFGNENDPNYCCWQDLSDTAQGWGPHKEGTAMYLVIEATPGYMAETEPAEFDEYGDAVAYANELADELEEEGYDIDRGWASRDNYFAIHATTEDKIHDLGRTIEVIADWGDGY